MIDVEQSARKPAASAYATLPIRTAKDRCVALALATTNLTTSALLLGTWMCSRTILYSNGFSYSRIYGDFAGTLGAFNFLTTVLCILASYLCQGRRWRMLFALCALLGTLCFCLMACKGQMYRE